MSFEFKGPSMNKPMIQEAQMMKNNGGGGNTGYMNQNKKKKDEEKDDSSIFLKEEKSDNFIPTKQNQEFQTEKTLNNAINKLKNFFKK